jgi:hypothetical protein
MLPRAVTCSPPCSIQNQQTANIRPSVQFRTIVYIVNGGFVVVLTVAVMKVVFLAVVVRVLLVAVLVVVDVVLVDVVVVFAELTASELSDYLLKHCFVFENFD